MKNPVNHHKNKPLVSIIMPVKDGERYLDAAIESILAQTWQNWELIVVDDGSTDKTSAILAQYARKDARIKVITNKENLGVAASLNKALKMARGQYIARMDADDISLPERLEKQVEFLAKNPNIVAVGCQVEVIDEEDNLVGKKEFPSDPQTCYHYLMLTVPIQHPTLMAKSEAIKKYGYNERLWTAEDWDLYFKLLQEGQLSNLKETLYLYRQYFGSNGFHEIRKAFWLVLKTRLWGIIKYGYRPSMGGILATLAQLFLVLVLPQKVIFNLFRLWRVKPFPFAAKARGWLFQLG